MRIHAIGLVGLLFVFGSASAEPSPPASDASIHALLQVTKVHKMLDTMMIQMDDMMKKVSRQATAGQPIDAGAQKIIDAQTSKLNDVLMQQISWEKMEPMYVSLYRKTFTQKEVDDMLAFYRSPSGQSVIVKMPVMMAQAMQTVQGELANLLPQVQKIEMETASSLSAYEASKKRAPAQPSINEASDSK